MISTAAILTTNIDGEACQGKIWILTCTGRSHTHRWTLEMEGSEPIMMTYTARQSVPGTNHMGPYNFTLVSASNDWFESIVSTVLTTALNNTVAKCGDTNTEAEVTIRIAGSIILLITIIAILWHYYYFDYRHIMLLHAWYS